MTVGALFFSAVIILSPFSVLINHFHWNRSIWAIVPIILLISFIIENIQKQKVKLLFCGMFFTWFLIHGYSSALEVKKRKEYIYSQIVIQKQLKLSIAKQLKKDVPVVIYVNTRRYSRNGRILSGFLSTNFPNQTFIVKDRKFHDRKSYPNSFFC